MKLERIIAREFMGMSFDERLTAANVFIATNWAGKTARANAITVLLLGYLPKLGKRNQDTARLMSAREMHVEGHFTGGIVMSRTFRMSGASVKCDAKIPPELAGEGTLAIMLNANEYFAQTDQQRRDYVFGLLDLSALTQFSEDSMIGELREAVKAASGDDEATRKAVGALVARIQRAANEAERDIPRDASCAPGEDPTLTPQQWLSTALEAAADFTKTAKEYAARMEKTVQGITTLKLQDTAPAVSLTAVEAQRERVTRERDNIVQRREELLAQKKQIDAARLNRGRLTEMLRELQPRIEALATLKQRLAANTAGTPEAQSAREEIVRERTKLDTRQHEIDSAAVRRREINAQLPSLRRARDKATACRDHLAELEKTFSFEKLTAAGSAISSAEEVRRFNGNEQQRIARDMLAYRASMTKLEAELAEFATATKCPTCGAAGEGWKTLRTSALNTEIQELTGKITALSDELDELKEAEIELTAAVTKAKQTHESLMKLGRERDSLEREAREYERFAAEADKLEAELKELPAEDPQMLQRLGELNAKWSASNAALEERRSLEAQIAKAEASATEVQRINAELTALTPDDPQIDGAIAAQDAEYRRNCDRANELDQQRRLAEKRQHDAQRAAEAEQQRTEALAEVAVSKIGAATLKVIQERFVKAAFDPVLTAANAHFGAILQTPLAYNDGEIGTWRGGTWVSHKTFSGAEERLAYCAISMALAARSRLKLAIIDELGTVAEENVIKLLDAVDAALKSGFITQFVGIDAGRVARYHAHNSETGIEYNVRDLAKG